MQGYTPSGKFRGSIDISTPAPYPYKTTPEKLKAYDNLTFSGVRSRRRACHTLLLDVPRLCTRISMLRHSPKDCSTGSGSAWVASAATQTITTNFRLSSPTPVVTLSA